ncbi:MAG: ATP-binding protein [Microbacteriaceae bacterium]
MNAYLKRIIDSELDELFQGIAAISLDGPKGVGKTVTATQRAATILKLDDPAVAEVLRNQPGILDSGRRPILLDEWQRVPEVWDIVRRRVDDDARGGQFLLTGSAAPVGAAIHSGAGRIVRLRMRPLSIAERGIETPTVSLAALFAGGTTVAGETSVTLETYVREILSSGFPGIRGLTPRQRRTQLDSYITNVIEKEFAEQGQAVRRPDTLRRWMAAYAAATSSTAMYSTILDAATSGQGNKPAKTTTIAYRDVLTQLWLLDPVPPRLFVQNDFARLTAGEKHYLADPALAARLLEYDEDKLLDGAQSTVLGPQEGTILGRLFESLLALSLQSYAQAAEARLSHLRTQRGDHEVDFIVHRGDGVNVAFEVKLSRTVSDSDVKHLLWLKQKLGDSLRDMVVVTTGTTAYRRRDGVAVVPAALLGA